MGERIAVELTRREIHVIIRALTVYSVVLRHLAPEGVREDAEVVGKVMSKLVKSLRT